MAEQLLVLDELTERVGITARNVRFYTSRGLVPPPLRRGRSGYYTADHVARLELVGELRAHGFTLAAIERYMAGIPADAGTDDIALYRTMLAPWLPEAPVRMTREDLEARAGRSLSEAELDCLVDLGVVGRGPGGGLTVAVAQLAVGVGLLDLDFPREAARAAAEVYADHGRQIADELYEVFRERVWPRFRDDPDAGERLREVVERVKPLSVASLVNAYEAAMDEHRAEAVDRKARAHPA